LNPVATAPGSELVDPLCKNSAATIAFICGSLYCKLNPVATAPGSELVDPLCKNSATTIAFICGSLYCKLNPVPTAPGSVLVDPLCKDSGATIAFTCGSLYCMESRSLPLPVLYLCGTSGHFKTFGSKATSQSRGTPEWLKQRALEI
jgi:hypothetical protein